MQDLRVPVDRPSRSGTDRRRRAVLALGAALLTVAAASCSRPDNPPPPPPTGPCHPIDFERAEVRPAPSPRGTTVYVLRVTGEKPSLSQTVKLVPVTYIRQPEYWRIEVQACDPPEAGLPATGRYDVSLTLSGAMGTKGIEVAGTTRTQRFDLGSTPAPSPVGSWHVTGVSGGFTGGIVPVVEGSTISLDIKADGTLGGRACNSYWANWKVDGSTVAISDIAATKMACPAPGVGEQENRYFSALRATRSWRIERDRLVLTDENGRDVATAERGSVRPEPTTTSTTVRSTRTSGTTHAPTTEPATTTTTTRGHDEHGGHGHADAPA